MSSLTGTTLPKARPGAFSRFTEWMDAMPHPAALCEIAADHVGVARWSGSGGLDAGAAEPLEAGAIKPSTVEANIVNPDALYAALRKVLERVPMRGQPVALLVPDAVVRVFIFPFETLPRRAEDATPLLRWRLKKSVPFDVEDTVVSSMRQTGRDGGLEVITAVARRPIVREYEHALESLGVNPGVVLSSTVACLPLLSDSGATMLVRAIGNSLTTAIVRNANLCVYRSTSLGVEVSALEPHAVLDEVFPAAAYYQDTWGGQLDHVLIAGFGERAETVRVALGTELKVNAERLSEAAAGHGLSADARGMLGQGLEALAGWMANGA